MISLKKLIKEFVDVPPPIIQHAEIFSQDFIDFVKNAENAAKVGYKKGKWYPHKSYEGGLPTIAWGHKIKSKEELKRVARGISDKEAEGLLKKDLEIAKATVQKYMKGLGVNIPLSKVQTEMLTEFAFNLGGLEKFPKFAKAVLNKDWATAKKESKRFAAGKELTRRNKLFNDRYFK